MKPLFIPLKAEYFDRFKTGCKTIEMRKYGPRWNEKTCTPGRPVVLSRGYGKKDRLHGRVFGHYIGKVEDPEFIKIFGRVKGIMIRIELLP